MVHFDTFSQFMVKSRICRTVGCRRNKLSLRHRFGFNARLFRHGSPSSEEKLEVGVPWIVENSESGK